MSQPTERPTEMTFTNLNLSYAEALTWDTERHGAYNTAIGTDGMSWYYLHSRFASEVSRGGLPEFVVAGEDSWHDGAPARLARHVQRGQIGSIAKNLLYSAVMPAIGESISKLSSSDHHMPITVLPNEQVGVDRSKKVAGGNPLRAINFNTKLAEVNGHNELLWQPTIDVLKNADIAYGAHPEVVARQMQAYATKNHLGRVVLNMGHWDSPIRDAEGEVMPEWNELVPELVACKMVYGLEFTSRPDFGGSVDELAVILKQESLERTVSGDRIIEYRNALDACNSDQPLRINMKLPASAVKKAINVSGVQYDNEYSNPRVAATAQLVDMLRKHVALS